MSKMDGAGDGRLGSDGVEDEDEEKDKDEGEMGETWANMLEEVLEWLGGGGGWVAGWLGGWVAGWLRWLGGWVAEVDEKWHCGKDSAALRTAVGVGGGGEVAHGGCTMALKFYCAVRRISRWQFKSPHI